MPNNFNIQKDAELFVWTITEEGARLFFGLPHATVRLVKQCPETEYEKGKYYPEAKLFAVKPSEDRMYSEKKVLDNLSDQFHYLFWKGPTQDEFLRVKSVCVHVFGLSDEQVVKCAADGQRSAEKLIQEQVDKAEPEHKGWQQELLARVRCADVDLLLGLKEFARDMEQGGVYPAVKL